MKHRFFLVDNDGTFGESMKLMLSLAGHDVEWAVNGKCVEAKLPRQLPDVILMDYRLGDTDGLTMARRIKVDPMFSNVRDVPIILSTAMGEESLPDCTGDMISAFLRKPYTMDELVSATDRVTQKV